MTRTMQSSRRGCGSAGGEKQLLSAPLAAPPVAGDGKDLSRPEATESCGHSQETLTSHARDETETVSHIQVTKKKVFLLDLNYPNAYLAAS